jgi:protein-S-isoprenylcysteine O-methyltransferase Ste14
MGKKEKSPGAIITGIICLIFIVLVFILAGTARWLEVWIFLGAYVAGVAGLVIWLKKHDPALLRERRSVKKDVKRWDRVIMGFYTVALAAFFLIVPLDAVRFGWSRVPWAVKGPAFLVVLLSSAVIFWTMRENAYLSKFVRIQKDRGHSVCTTGPYRIVRHPMYAAIIPAFFCLSLFLGSLYGLIPAAAISALFVLRTALEDRTLQQELEGYKEYAGRVRWRLVPKIW